MNQAGIDEFIKELKKERGIPPSPTPMPEETKEAPTIPEEVITMDFSAWSPLHTILVVVLVVLFIVDAFIVHHRGFHRGFHRLWLNISSLVALVFAAGYLNYDRHPKPFL